ncbi:hypothetical protein ACIQGT_36570 [Streptomyces sp. NPDC093108]|uniref:hypothetical protein n=1 Tax=Streptomyces sp. NPDC093108 TaxID=3366030 RepID=UPI0038176912
MTATVVRALLRGEPADREPAARHTPALAGAVFEQRLLPELGQGVEAWAELRLSRGQQGQEFGEREDLVLGAHFLRPGTADAVGQAPVVAVRVARIDLDVAERAQRRPFLEGRQVNPAIRASSRTTAGEEGYAASDADWVKYLGDALDNVKFRKIKDLYERHTAGDEIGFGPGAERVKDAFDQITATVKARNGDARTADTLLRTTRIHIRFGMLNNCTADQTNPVGAVCLENAIVPEGHTGPLDERCRPDRCANSMIGLEHLPIYDSHQRTQLKLINSPKVPACRRDLAERELDITRNVLAMAKGAS